MTGLLEYRINGGSLGGREGTATLLFSDDGDHHITFALSMSPGTVRPNVR